MGETVAVVMPAWRAEQTIVAAVESVLGQSFADWALWLVADDGADYQGLLAQAGIGDTRIRFGASGGMGLGVARARNMALEAIEAPFVALLDADDRFKPGKLELAVAALGHYPIVSTALDVMSEGFKHLRHVGQGADSVLSASTHKWRNLSMDSMIAWDRRRTDGRYDPTLANMSDLDFLLQLYRRAPLSLHLGTPLHDYIKRSSSLSNGPQVTLGMIRSKTEILRRLESGSYGLSTADTEGVSAFLRVSLRAETGYADALARQPGLLFEDHLEPMLPQRGR